MKSKAIFFFLLLLGNLFATEINGGFEQCIADLRGIPQPRGWFLDRISKKATARLARESGCARTGIFGLLTETEEGGMLYFRTYKQFPVAPGDTIEMEVFVRGSGRFRLNCYTYGTDDPQKISFIQSIAISKPSEARETKWDRHSVKKVFVIPKKGKGKFTRFAIRPVICVYSDSEILFDDFKIKITPAKTGK